MKETLEQFIAENKLFQKWDKLLLTVSGGADSTALCFLLHQLDYNFIIAHCNFQLRGAESNLEERFVHELGSKLGRKVFSKRFDIEGYVDGKSISIQMAARELRYQWFNELAAAESCHYIVTAHHLSDNLETILLNFTRGTGIKGLRGIKPKNNNLVRPLLPFTKQQILNFLINSNIEFKEDSSNKNNKYKRNRVRNEVIPQLKILNPNLEDTLKIFLDKIRDLEEISNSEIQKFKRERIHFKGEEVYIDLEMIENEVGLSTKLFEVLEEYHFTYPQVKEIIKSITKQAGKIFTSSSSVLVKDRNQIIISPGNIKYLDYLLIESSDRLVTFNSNTFEFVKSEGSLFNSIKDRSIAQLDYNKLEYPLTIRFWKEGDFFFPLGMEKKKKLSDFFIDLKIPLPEKTKKLIMCSGNDIIWIVGERIDNRFKITGDTRQILTIKLKK